MPYYHPSAVWLVSLALAVSCPGSSETPVGVGVVGGKPYPMMGIFAVGFSFQCSKLDSDVVLQTHSNS